MKPLSKRQRDFARYYADPGSETRGNVYQSAKRAGYSESYAMHRAHIDLLGNIGVKAEIDRLEAENAEAMDWDREKAVGRLTRVAGWLEAQAERGNIAASNALISALREMSAISGLHSSKVQTEDVTPDRELTYEEQSALDEAAALVKLRLTQPRRAG